MKAAIRKGDRRWSPGLGLVLLLLLGVLPGTATAVLIDIPNTYSGTVGDVIDVAVTTEDLTGLGVTSYEFDLTWSSTRFTVVDVIEAGTLTASWGDAEYAAGAGTLTVAAAGGTSLSGSGTLVTLRIQLGPASGGVYLYFQDFLFNEGSPAATTDDGYVAISALPTINVSPDTGEILVGATLPFAVSGATPPVTWGTTDPAVATIDAAGTLTGVSPGSVRVWAEDAAAVRDTTTGLIDVRAMELSLPTTSAAPGAFFILPVTVTDLTPYGIRGFEFEMTFTASRLTVIGASEVGTMTAGWIAPAVHAEPGRVTLAMAGQTPLVGSGVLVNLFCIVPLGATNGTTLALGEAIFDESYVPLKSNGYFTVNVPPAIWITPDTATMTTDETRTFAVGGSPAPPFTWGTTDPAVGTIDASGVFTPGAGGNCRVFVQDAAGARDTTNTISVYDLRVTAESKVVQTAVPVTPIPVSVDRDVTGLDIYGYEMTFSFSATRVRVVAVTDSGGLGAGWGAPVVQTWPDSVRIVHAGDTPLVGGPAPLFHVYFEPAPGALDGWTTSLQFRNITLNEGSPRPWTVDGTLTIGDTITGVGDGARLSALSLAQNRPNPFPAGTTIQFGLDRRDWSDLSLTILDPTGRIVRRWDLAGAQPGPHAVRWDGRDGTGHRVSSGVYFYRLAGSGEEATRKMVILR